MTALKIGMASKLHFLICSPNAAQNQQHGDKLKICNLHTVFTVSCVLYSLKY